MSSDIVGVYRGLRPAGIPRPAPFAGASRLRMEVLLVLRFMVIGSGAAVGLGGMLGCVSFFEELQSENDDEGSEGDDDSTEAGSGSASEGSAACEFPKDDVCHDQDRLTHCDPETEESTPYDCSVLCGANLNLSCITTGTGAHGCWCVTPASFKGSTCSQLDECLRGCATATDDSCNDACISRTDAKTVRMYGVLISCAHNQCHEQCLSAPESCSTCINAGIGGGGECGLARAVCDSDDPDDPSSIWE